MQLESNISSGQHTSLTTLNKPLSNSKQKKVDTGFLERIANTLTNKAEKVLAVDRQVNTARQSRMAEHADSNARADLQLASTILRIAEGIKSGQVKFLAKIKNKAQVELLEWLLSHANQARTSRFGIYNSKPLEEEDADYASYPYGSVGRRSLREISNDFLEKIPSLKEPLDKLSELLMERFKEYDCGYLDTDEKLQLFNTIIKTLDDAPVYTRGIIEQINCGMRRYNLLTQMGINNPPTLVAALKEYINYRSDKPKEPPLKRMQRELASLTISGYFPTPKLVIERMLELANIQPSGKILEPSAGSGHLAEAIKEHHPDNPLSVIEINQLLSNILKAKGFNAVGSNFLEHTKSYSYVLMNPPFENSQDIKHVHHAYELLNEGGRLVSIMGEGAFFRSDKQATEFRSWLESIGGYSEKLSDGSFLASERPTTVSTRIVVIDKPNTTSNGNTQKLSINPQLLEPLSETAKQLAEKANSILTQDVEVLTSEESRKARTLDFEARVELHLANTIDSIIQTIVSGKTNLLSSIREQADVEVLESILQSAKHCRPFEAGKDLVNDDPNLADLDRVKYPYPMVTSLMLRKVFEIESVEALNVITSRVKKLALQERIYHYVLVFTEPSQVQDYEEMVNLVKPVNSWLAEMLLWNKHLAYYKRLQSLGLKDLPTLIEALKEYLSLRTGFPQINPIKNKQLSVMHRGIEGYFVTPKAVVAKMIELGNIKPGMKILNACAGAGNIADAIRKFHPNCNISVIEKNCELQQLLKAKDHKIVDFDLFNHEENYDLILMASPYELYGQYDITCFYQAYNLLVPGGKLVAIISEESFSCTFDYSTGFRKWLKTRKAIIQELSEGILVDKHTGKPIAARIVVVEKTTLF